jgi:hypothetical protein
VDVRVRVHKLAVVFPVSFMPPIELGHFTNLHLVISALSKQDSHQPLVLKPKWLG